MHRLKGPLLILLGFTLLLGVAGLEAYVSHRNDAAIVQLDADYRRVRTETQEVEHQLASTTRSLAESRARSSAPHSTKTPAHAAPSTPRPNFAQILRDDPELQNLQLAALRAGLSITYSPLYRKLGLDAAKTHALEAAIFQRNEKTQDIWATVPADAALAQKLVDQVNADYSATVRTLLGEAGAQVVHEYERRTRLREMVAGYAGTMALAGIPFDRSQAEQLTDTLASAAAVYPHGDWFDRQQIAWPHVYEQAKSFLSPAQLTFIETTEPRGPGGSGGRFLGELNEIFENVIKTDVPKAGP